MKSTATGRILFWRGGSLWIGLAGEPTGLHAHRAVQIALPFPRGRVQFQGPSGSWSSYTAALVAAHQPHAFEARAQLVAQIFVEPESCEGRQLHRRNRNEGIVELPSGVLEQHVVELATAYENRASNAALIGLARAAITALSGTITGPEKLPDARIARAVELIRERLGDTIPLSTMAAAVHLSPDRFRHLDVRNRARECPARIAVSFNCLLPWVDRVSFVQSPTTGASNELYSRRSRFEFDRKMPCHRPD